VASRKLGLSRNEIKDILDPIRTLCEVVPLSIETHDRGVEIAERYGFSLFDATIIASALQAGCAILYSEDLQHDQRIASQFESAIRLAHDALKMMEFSKAERPMTHLIAGKPLRDKSLL